MPPSPSPSPSPPSPQPAASPSKSPPPPPPQAPFAPLFTLVTNGSSKTTHHPKVRYIFADDDPDTLTQALADHHTANEAREPSRDRALVLDLAPASDGSWSVAAASSLSADFAIVDAKITQMEDSEREGDGGLMLRIEGVENEPASVPAALDADLPSSGSGAQIGASQGREEYGAILEEFDKKMGILKRVVAAGEERMRKIQAQQAPPTAESQEAKGKEVEE